MGTQCVTLLRVPMRGLKAVGEQSSNKAKKRKARRQVADQVPKVLCCHNHPPKTEPCKENRLKEESTESR